MSAPAQQVAHQTFADEQARAVIEVQGAVAKISRVAEGIAELRSRYASVVFDVTTRASGMMTMAMAIVSCRT